MKRINIIYDNGKEKIELFYPKASIEFYKDCVTNQTYIMIFEALDNFMKSYTHIPFNKIIELTIEEN